MKRPLILTTAILMILGTNTSVAQGDADNFYKSNSVNTEKVSFSNQYKMKVGARLFLPKELEEPYLSYNVLQRAQGFDLEPCCGKTVERCTYTVKNHPSGKVCQADLYICGGEIVAGDILCTGEGGFIAPLAFPKDA